MLRNIVASDSAKVMYLTARDNRGEHLVLLRRCQNKDSVSWWLLQCFQKRIEGTRRKHMHLVDDIDPILTRSRGNIDLLYQLADIIHRVIGGSIQLHDIIGALFIGSDTTLTMIARLPLRSTILTIDRLRKYPSTRRFPHPTRATEEVGVR
ncbi:Uncharacterised protein [Chlamydia trachomatis]|nr:Uncharacterised protein [Chlamydia trachomatis]